MTRIPKFLYCLWLFSLTTVSFILNAQHTTGKPYPLTLKVSADGSSDYTSINEALQQFRAYSPVPLTLVIGKGIYHEKVVIPHWLCNLTITGESRDSTIISFDDYSGKPFPDGPRNGRTAFSTFNSYTMAVYGNDIRLQQLTIRNNAGPVGQAVALHVEGDRVAVTDCTLLGHQDTLFTGNDSSRQYYARCYIEGTTDFIFGPATVLFRDCVLHSLRNSYITAASTPERKTFGYVFEHCRLTAAPGINKVYLGRPWRRYARTVFIHTDMGAHIRPKGWDNWRDTANEKTAFYAEYGSTGPGADRKTRVPWSHQLSAEEKECYTPARILGEWAATIPQ